VRASTFSASIVFLAVTSVLIGLLAGCGSTPPARAVDPEISRASGAARRAFEGGDFDGAVRLYRKGLKRARATDDSSEIARIAYNLSLCLIVLERYDEASEYLNEARDEFTRRGEIPSDLEILEAKLSLKQGKIDEAEARLTESFSRRSKNISPADEIQFVILAARIELDRNDLNEARHKLEKARGIFQKLSPEENTLLEGRLFGLEGELFSAENDFARAAEAFDRQADLLQEAGKYRQMARARGMAGDAFEKAGKPARAGDRLFRAARSLFAQGDDLEAVKMIDRAFAAADRSGEKELRKKIAELLKEIEKSAE